MIADGQDGTVSRLRRELDAVEVRGDRAEVDGVLARLHQRRHRQRRQRVLVSLAAVAVLLVGGGFAVVGRGATTGVPVAAPVAEWSPRGDLAGDTALVSGARRVWAAGGTTRVVYAGTSPNRAASVVVVVLASVDARGDTTVGFVTSAVSTKGTPDPARLVLRASAPVSRGQRAVGFVSAAALPGDEPLVGGGSIGFAVVEPGADEIALRTSVLDDQAPTPSVERGVTWGVFQTGVGAWNTVAVLGGGTTVPLASGAKDPRVTATTLAHTGDLLTIPDVGGGSLLITPDGLLGVVGPGGAVNTDLGAIPDLPVVVAISGAPGRLTNTKGGLVFRPTGSGTVATGNRIVYADPRHPGVLINVGVVTSTDRVMAVLRRSATPGTATTILRVDGL